MYFSGCFAPMLFNRIVMRRFPGLTGNIGSNNLPDGIKNNIITKLAL